MHKAKNCIKAGKTEEPLVVVIEKLCTCKGQPQEIVTWLLRAKSPKSRQVPLSDQWRTVRKVRANLLQFYKFKGGHADLDFFIVQ